MPLFDGLCGDGDVSLRLLKYKPELHDKQQNRDLAFQYTLGNLSRQAWCGAVSLSETARSGPHVRDWE